MNSQELRERIVAWVVDVGRLASPLFRSSETSHRASQLKRAADSVAANYRAAQIAREGILRGDHVLKVLDEGRQLTRILAKSRETAQANEGLSRKR